MPITIRRPLIVVACWRLNHALFEFDSSFVVPETKPELARLARTIDANPGCPMAMFGHADPVGDDDYNKALSGRRARALHAVLTRNVAAWEELFSSPMQGDTWGLRSTQRILGFLDRVDGTGPYLAGGATGTFDAATDDAIRAFQSEHGLMVDGVAGPKTREALYRAYMDAICLGEERQLELTAKDFIHEAGAFQGCGEFNPVYLLSKADAAGVERDERNQLNAPNRRVMIFFFEQGTVIDKEDWPCPKWNAPAAGCHKALWPDADKRRKNGEEAREYRVDRRTMACRFYDRMAHRSPCEGVQRVAKFWFGIRLINDDRLPIGDAAYVLKTDLGHVRRGKTTPDGVIGIYVPMPENSLTLTVTPNAPRHPQHRTHRWVIAVREYAPATTVQGALNRLRHLDYWSGPILREWSNNAKRALQVFQSENGLQPTGTLDSATVSCLESVSKQPRTLGA